MAYDQTVNLRNIKSMRYISNYAINITLHSRLISDSMSLAKIREKNRYKYSVAHFTNVSMCAFKSV